MLDKVTVELTEEEAEWLATCLAMVMRLSRHWDDLSNRPDYGNAIAAKVTLARVQGNVGMDPDKWPW